MASKAKGILQTPVWYDSTDDEVKPLVNDDGQLPVFLAEVGDALDVRIYGYDGTTWQKLPLIWGYTDRWVENIIELNAVAGVNVIQSAAVSVGYVYELNAANTFNNTSVSGQYLEVVCGAVVIRLNGTVGVAAGTVTPTFPIGIRLKEGDYVRALFTGCVAGDDLYLRIAGVKMKVA